MEKAKVKRKVESLKGRKVKNLIFFWSIATIPLLLFAFDLIVINFNSILLAFKEYSPDGSFSHYGVYNFSYFFDSIFSGVLGPALLRSFLLYLLTLVVTSIIPIIFSYYLYHKYLGNGFFKVLLFLPNIISSVATILIFKYMVYDVLPTIGLSNLLSNDKAFTTIMIYTLWMQFGSGLLIQLGAMNATEKEVVEASHIDGVGFWGELWHVVLPKSYTILSIGMITGVMSIFTNDFGLYTFYGKTAPDEVITLGYKFLADTANAAGSNSEYSKLAAWGLCCTLVAAPLTFFVKWLVERVGPSED